MKRSEYIVKLESIEKLITCAKYTKEPSDFVKSLNLIKLTIDEILSNLDKIGVSK